MEISPPAGKTELLFFEPRPTQVQMLHGSWTDVRPMASLETSGPLNFRLPASTDTLIDLSRSFLYLRCRIVLKDGNLAVKAKPTEQRLAELKKAVTDATAQKAAAETALNVAQTNQVGQADALSVADTKLRTEEERIAVAEETVTPLPPTSTTTVATVAAKVIQLRNVREAAALAKQAADTGVRIAQSTLLSATANESVAQGEAVAANSLADASDTNYLVAPVANVLHSLFSNVDISLNGRSIVSSSGNYAYKSYISTILSSSRDAINSQYQSALFYPDDPKEFEINTRGFQTNVGLMKRYEVSKGSREFEIMDTLNIDLANQEKLLIPGINLTLTLRRNDPKFSLMSWEDGVEYRIDIIEAVYYVRQVEVSSAFLVETERRLLTETAKYYFQRLEVNVLPLNVMSTVINEANLSVASPALPNRIVVGIVETESQLGAYQRNPYFFSLAGLASINFIFNGQSMPYRMIPFSVDNTRDVLSQTSLMGYYSLFSQSGTLGHPQGSSWIGREDWLHGYALIVFDFTPDGTVGEHLQISRGGVLNLEMRFSRPLPRSYSVIMLSAYDSYLQISSDRSVFANFTLG